MSTRNDVAIWLDHEHAIVVTLEGEGERVETLQSSAHHEHQKQYGHSAPGRAGINIEHNEGAQTEQRAHDERQFYDEILDGLGEPHRVAIFGAGEARKAFETEMRKRSGLGDRIWLNEALDSLSERQFVQKARECFGSPAPRAT